MHFPCDLCDDKNPWQSLQLLYLRTKLTITRQRHIGFKATKQYDYKTAVIIIHYRRNV